MGGALGVTDLGAGALSLQTGFVVVQHMGMAEGGTGEG